MGAGLALGALVVGSVACNGDDDSSLTDLQDAAQDAADAIDEQTDDLADDMEEFSEELGEAMGAGGGGTLVVDGEEIPIDSVICQLGEDTFEVGTTSESGWRVFVSRGNPLNDVGAQVLDPDFLQWFPSDVQGDEAVRDGGTFTSGPYEYFNNQNDETVEISFTVECP